MALVLVTLSLAALSHSSLDLQCMSESIAAYHAACAVMPDGVPGELFRPISRCIAIWQVRDTATDVNGAVVTVVGALALRVVAVACDSRLRRSIRRRGVQSRNNLTTPAPLSPHKYDAGSGDLVPGARPARGRRSSCSTRLSLRRDSHVQWRWCRHDVAPEGRPVLARWERRHDRLAVALRDRVSRSRVGVHHTRDMSLRR